MSTTTKTEITIHCDGRGCEESITIFNEDIQSQNYARIPKGYLDITTVVVAGFPEQILSFIGKKCLLDWVRNNYRPSAFPTEKARPMAFQRPDNVIEMYPQEEYTNDCIYVPEAPQQEQETPFAINVTASVQPVQDKGENNEDLTPLPVS